MTNFVTGFIARVSVSAVVGGAVAAAVVMYARDLNIERLTGETNSVSERLVGAGNRIGQPGRGAAGAAG